MSLMPGGRGAQNGLDWSIHRRILKKRKSKSKALPLRGVWSGAVLCSLKGGSALCQLCGAPATYLHVLVECPSWDRRHRTLPSWYPRPVPEAEECFWARAWVPAHWTKQPALEVPVEKRGAFATGEPFPDHWVFATDASGGPGARDPRTRFVTWSVIVADVQGPTPLLKGSLVGYLPQASIYAGEAFALLQAAQSALRPIDVTADCQGVVRNWTRGRGGLFRTMWAGLEEQVDRVSCTWVSSHLSEEAFPTKFNLPLWRRAINQMADEACGDLARRIFPGAFAERVRALDIRTRKWSAFLAERLHILITAKSEDLNPYPKPRGSTPSSHRRLQFRSRTIGSASEPWCLLRWIPWVTRG
jgi:hypothetical protein